MKRKVILLLFIIYTLCCSLLPYRTEAAVNGVVYTNLPISNNCGGIGGHAVDYGSIVTSSSIDFSKTDLVFIYEAGTAGLYAYRYYETNGVIDIPYIDGFTYSSSSNYSTGCNFNHITNQYE